MSGARGLLQGHFRLDTVTLADSQGDYARIEGLALDWSPTALLTMRFHAEAVTSTKVVLSRLPVTTIEPATDDGSTFSLPVEVAIDRIDLPLVALGKAVVGRDTQIAVTGAAKAVSDQIAIDLKALEKARPEASATAKLAYGVNARTLDLDARITEPRGGLLAQTLTLPGLPPVEIAILGNGPLDAWQGSVSGKVDGAEVLALSGTHSRSPTGLHTLVVKGGGAIAQLLPPTLRNLFAGQTRLDVNADFSADGLLAIRSGSLANDSLTLDATGTLDPKGEASLEARLTPAGQTIDVSLPLASGHLMAALRRADMALSGPFRQTKLSFNAVVDRVATPDAGAETITVKANSPAFNLETRSGPLVMSMAAGATTFKNPQAEKLVQGPLKLDAAMDIAPDLIKVEKIALESPKLGGTISGDFAPATRQLVSSFTLFVLPDAILPPNFAGKAEGTIALSGKLAATLPDRADLTDLKLASNLIGTEGSAHYDAGTLTANLRGALTDLSLFAAQTRGKLDFAVDVSGLADAPKIAAVISSAEIQAAGQTLTNLDAKFDGFADPAKPSGKFSAAVTVLGQKIAAAADVTADKGLIAIPNLSLKAGANTLAGALAFDAAFRPTGRIDMDLADLAALAAMANQKADGALKGRLDLDSADGKTSLSLALTGARLGAPGVDITGPAIEARIADLTSPQIAGQLKAASIAAGANRLEMVALNFESLGDLTLVNLASQFDGAPLTLAGSIQPGAEAMALHLDAFTAAPRAIPVKLAAPTTIALRDGTATINGLTIAAGDGTIAIKGTNGKTLNLAVDIDALPASLANAFASDLGAEGTLSATASIKGNSTAPTVTFDASLSGASTAQSRAHDLSGLDITAKGTFTANVLKADLVTTLKDQPTTANVEVRLADGTIAVPSINLRIGETILSGNVTLDALSEPSGRFAFDIPDAAKLAALVGQKAEGALKGTVDFAQVDQTIKAKLRSTGALRGQPIAIALDAVSDKGALSLPALRIEVGKNMVSGGVTLNPQFLPTGTVGFDLPDLALLAALAGQKAEGALKGKADITATDNKIATKVDATGAIRGQDVIIAVEAISDKGTLSMPALRFDVGNNTLKGSLAFDAAFLPSGRVAFDLPDIALLAAMAGQKAEGAVAGSAEVDAKDGTISGTLKANGPKLVYGGTEIVKPAVDLAVTDLTTGQINGTVTADKVASGGNLLTKLALEFNRSGPATAFALASQYDGAPLAAKGAIEQQPDGGLTLKLASFSAAPKKIPVKLNAPVAIRIANGTVAFNDVSITAGQGKIAVTGSTGNTLDIRATISALPASLANTFASGLDASGSINATVTVSGNPAAPVVGFDTSIANASIGQIKAAGIQPLAISSKGKLASNVLTLDTTVRNGDGLSLTAKGTVGLTGAMPLSIAVNGQLPFSAAAARLAAQGIALKGDARFNLALKGSAAKPAISGTIAASGGTLTLIRQNLVINKLAANVSLSGDQARISSASGELAGGGTVSVSGTIGFAPGSGLPADLKIQLKNAVYVDGTIVAAKLTGDLAVIGKLQSGPALTGRIRLNRADITIPERLPGALSKINVKHKNAPSDVAVQSAEIKAAKGDKGKRDTSGGIKLDLKISAPRQIFVRGRGLDTELGGEVKVTGTSGTPNVAGGFKMVRGRLSIVGKRLDFTTGQITFGGGMMPYLNMVASSATGSTTVYVTVSGPANSPTFAFTSSPALPQDEVLAQLIFGRSATSLSAVQIAQLADAVATLAGGQSSSLFNKLRQGLGVDDLDVGSDENGKTNVSAGKYLNKRTYLQLQQGDTSKAVINLDIGKGVKLKGEAGADGSTATGIFYEKEY